MCIRTGVPVLAVLVHEDVSTHFGFFHFLNFLVELESLFAIDELLFLSLSGSLTVA